MLSGPAPFIMNWMEKGQLYDVDVYLSHHPANTFFEKLNIPKKKHKYEPIWSLRDLTYSLDHEESNRNTTVDLDLDMLQHKVFDKN